MNFKKKIILSVFFVLLLTMLSISVVNNNLSKENRTIKVSSNQVLSNKKIGWGIKRNDNNEQPELGTKNKELLDKYKGIAMRKL